MTRNGVDRNNARVLRGCVLVVTIAALLAGYGTPRARRNATPGSASIHAARALSLRPYFDQNAGEWTVPVAAAAPAPPGAEPLAAVPAKQLFPSLEAKGPHYNRPPPAV
jgi:hypothetical protein